MTAAGWSRPVAAPLGEEQLATLPAMALLGPPFLAGGRGPG